jgi:gliding motility-associated-like protein
VRHCNKKDYWVITHKYNSDEYYAYLAGENGVASPVISKAGSMLATYYYNWNAAGQLKASPDGKKLAAANSNNGIDLLDFDNQTGMVSNGVELFGNDNGAHYGVEFSPNSKVLYAAVKGYFNSADNMRLTSLFQYDLSQSNTAAIIASRNTLLTYNGPTDESGSLQRGPDKRVYLAHYNKAYLSIVNNPDNMGAACNFEEKGLLLPSNGRFNLPNQLNEYGYAQIDSFKIFSSTFCPGSTVQFNYTPVAGISSLQWNFDDQGSGSNNLSTLENPTHRFSQAGTYRVQLIKYGPCSNDTLKKTITLSDLNIDLGKDTEVCEKLEINLSPLLLAGNASQYRWQDGSTQPSLKAKTSGLYWVEITSEQGCKKTDSLMVSYKPYPVVNLGTDQLLCKGKTLQLDAGNAGSNFLWQDGSKGQQFTVVETGNYRVTVNLNGCSASDDMVVTEALPPQFSLGPDLELCIGEQAELNPKISNVQFKWQDGSSSSSLIANKTGMYVLEATNGCGSSADTFNLKLVNCQLAIPNAFTPNGDGKNELLRVRNGGNLEFFEMEIYNRWGQPVYKSSNWQLGWDGRVNGFAADNGSYVYMIRYRVRGEILEHVKRGTVVLLR